ncbi:MAG: inositol monophosphatase [Chloroflexi bacterium]|nr:inositol monophosphatase [Chloroflexota bacterium]MBM4451456.1 inositol monophosphatase [Chloroflexota bacterium]
MSQIPNTPTSKSGKAALHVAILAAQKAGDVLLANFHSDKQAKHKGKGNLVTLIDLLAEKAVMEVLKQEYPNHRILSEETNSTTDTSGYTWIVDPLDGTNNYVYGLPFFCTNVALARDEDILVGVTYAPMTRELFRAEKGKGAYLNDSPIHVSDVSTLEAAMIGFDLGYDDQQAREMLSVAIKLWGKIHCMRLIGSSALGLAYVVAGRISLYYHRFIYPWDIAPGLLLVQEAGGTVTDWQGNPATIHNSQIIASNLKLHSAFTEYTK